MAKTGKRVKRQANQQSDYFVSNFKDIRLYLKNRGKCGKVLRLKWKVNHFMNVIYFAFSSFFQARDVGSLQ